jgi:hypothetical protein
MPGLPQRALEQAEHGEQRDKPQHLQRDPHDNLPGSVVSPGVAASDLVLDLAVPFPDDALGIGLHHVVTGSSSIRAAAAEWGSFEPSNRGPLVSSG